VTGHQLALLFPYLIVFLVGGSCGAVLIGPRLGSWPPGHLARSRQDCPGPAGCRLARREDSYDGS
jgi:hypothetical protein